MKCPHCNRKIPDATLKSEAARLASAARTTFGGGRPFANKKKPAKRTKQAIMKPSLIK